MTSSLRLDIFTPAGAKRDIIAPQQCAYRRKVEEPGQVSFTVVKPRLIYDFGDLVEVKLKNPRLGLDWYPDFTGFVERIEEVDEPIPLVMYTVVEDLARLAHPINAFPAGRANRTQFTNVPVETIMKTLVTNNLTGAGGAPRDAPLGSTPITVEADQARGATLTRGNARTNVLKEIKYLAEAANCSFGLTKLAQTTMQFIWKAAAGTDRTATVVFSRKRGTMRNPRRIRDQSQYASRAIVGGKGEGDAREIVVVGTAGRETFVHATHVDAGNTAELTDIGTVELVEREREDRLEFEVVQTDTSYYGIHYFLGDLATARSGGQDRIVRIEAVDVTLRPDGFVEVMVEVEEQ